MNLMMRLFPAEWRVRYGDEFLALLEDQPAGRRRWLDITRCLIAAHLDRSVPPSLDPSVGGGKALIAATVIVLIIAAALGAVFVGTASESALRKAADLVAPLLISAPVAMVLALGRFARRHGDRPVRAALPTLIADAIVLSVAGLILAATLTPQLGFFEQSPAVELRPFVDVATALTAVERMQAVADLVGNAMLFMVLGFALAIRRGSPRAASVLLTAVGFAIAIEVGQAALGTGRPADSTDVLLRALGAAVGYGLWRLARRGVADRIWSDSADGRA